MILCLLSVFASHSPFIHSNDGLYTYSFELTIIFRTIHANSNFCITQSKHWNSLRYLRRVRVHSNKKKLDGLRRASNKQLLLLRSKVISSLFLPSHCSEAHRNERKMCLKVIWLWRLKKKKFQFFPFSFGRSDVETVL